MSSDGNVCIVEQIIGVMPISGGDNLLRFLIIVNFGIPLSASTSYNIIEYCILKLGTHFGNKVVTYNFYSIQKKRRQNTF